MKPGWLLALILAGAAAGCTGDAGNPNLAAPKLIVENQPDGNLSLFVHSAFGERMYEWIAVALDNETVANRTHAFSWEGTTDQRAFFLEVSAGLGGQTYALSARFDVEPEAERAIVTRLAADGTWQDPRRTDLPVEQLLDRGAES